MFLPKTSLKCQVKGCFEKLIYDGEPPYPNCTKCSGEMGVGDPNIVFNYDLVCLNSDCNDGNKRVEIILGQDIDTVEVLPICKTCSQPLDYYWHNSNIGFQGFTTPGGNGSPNFNRLPSEIRGWAKNKYAQDRELGEKARKPIQWPDGTVR
jgi:hypothetical protein